MAAMAAMAGCKARSCGTAVRQVTKSNFASVLKQIRADIEAADFVAVSTRMTGDSSSSSSHRWPWRRILPIDTSETSYLKCKLAAESFELFQVAICPFSIHGSKVIAFPYNFHLFPRDELQMGLPSYSFSCQPSFLSSMAREGFDFNTCIYDGISYLSRVQEARARERNRRPSLHPISSSRILSVADSIFKERIKSRVYHWRKAYEGSSQESDLSLVQSLRKLLLGGEAYGSRPCMSLDVCSERQVQLVFETVVQISDDLVPIFIPDNGGQPKAVRVVLTTSQEDKTAFLTEIEKLENEQNLKLRGFREVIDIISKSHKTVISHDCLRNFTFIHEKFIGSLPATLPEFMCSLKLLFSNVIDLNNLLKVMGPLRKAKNISSALQYIKRHFFLPIEIEVPEPPEDWIRRSHGNYALRIASLFAKLSMLLKTSASQTALEHSIAIEDYANVFHPSSISLKEQVDDDDNDDVCWTDANKRVKTDSMIFLWGFGGTISMAELKQLLLQIHPVFSEEFDVQLVDKTCAVVVLGSSDSSKAFLEAVRSVETAPGKLRECFADGLRVAGYDAYKNVCMLGLWEGDLADSLDIVMAEQMENICSSHGTNANEIYWNSEMMIDLNHL